jgi:simple sugar transport system ATP-binding protein
MSLDYILQLEDVSKYFGSVIALNGVTLRLQRGEVTLPAR